MTLEYNKKFENKHQNFIGYITSEGETLDYSRPFGNGGHDRNHVTDFFARYFYYDIYEDYGRIITINHKNEWLIGEEYKKAFRNYCREKLLEECRSIEWRLKEDWYVGKDDMLKLRLRNLFINCYQNEDFFQGFGRRLALMDKDTFEEFYEQTHNLSNKDYDEKNEEIEWAYNDYWAFMILSYLKDTFVQYLGYDSVEIQLPRTICTSHFNINERFYNYKLMDFHIQQVPKMIYDPIDKMYKPIFIEYQTEKEEFLEKEIQSIKRLVKREDRYNYFR